MKRNGICPICYLKKLFTKPETITEIFDPTPYDNGVALTPPMGWSSWNTFRNRIDEDLIYDTAVAMKESGLADAGYTYVNLDDNWHSSLRDEDGNLQGDLTTFAHGIPALVEKINALGLKVGIYSSNGTKTCENLPGTLHHEKQDALTFAKWGIEYFKYDFCHHEIISKYAPLVHGITVAKKGEKTGTFYPCTEAKLFGLARLMTDRYLTTGKHVSGLDANQGAMEYANVIADEDGEYVLTVDIRKKGKYEKCLMVKINDSTTHVIYFPPQNRWNHTARFQVPVILKAGANTIRLFNPIRNRADSAMIQYQNMGKQLVNAANRVASDTNKPVKPIAFSLCEWGRNKPWIWGATAGNLWRTTMDIRPIWHYIINVMYRINVTKDKYASKGHWNDPDMLEVGNGKLTLNENIAHFSLWCMMASPLILGNDLRTISDEVLAIVTNKKLIAINQDSLGVQAHRVRRGRVDILVKPLSDGSVAICFLNKYGPRAKSSYNLKKLEKYGLPVSGKYQIENLWSCDEFESDGILKAEMEKHSVKVFKVKAI